VTGLLAAGLNDSFVVLILASAILYGTPLLFAALGEVPPNEPVCSIWAWRG
jgi:hypothetical protein